MSSNRTKYSEEMREQTAIFILESGKSATSVAEEMGIDVNTVCRWVRDYRRKHNMPTYAEEKGIRCKPAKDDIEYKQRIKDLEAKVREINKKLEEEKMKVEILKKSLRIFMQPQE